MRTKIFIMSLLMMLLASCNAGDDSTNVQDIQVDDTNVNIETQENNNTNDLSSTEPNKDLDEIYSKIKTSYKKDADFVSCVEESITRCIDDNHAKKIFEKQYDSTSPNYYEDILVLCEDHITDDAVTQCKENIIMMQAFSSQDLKICDKLTQGVDTCKGGIISTKAVNEKNIDLCNELTGDAVNQCKIDSISELATTTLDKKYCDLIPEDENNRFNKEMCLDEIKMIEEINADIDKMNEELETNQNEELESNSEENKSE